jgi:hypothetical protein
MNMPVSEENTALLNGAMMKNVTIGGTEQSGTNLPQFYISLN